MRVQFWGTRGSIPKAGTSTVRHGGNTSCVEVRTRDGTLLVLDCGTGAHGLGQALLTRGEGQRGHLLITHTHWDHIQGLPFFAPLFAAGNEWDVYAPRGLNQSVRDTLAGQMQYTYFPVTLEELGATIRYHELVEGRFAIGDVQVTTRYLNHPALTLGYRLEADGVVLVYATDHEPQERRLAGGLQGDLGTEERGHLGFLAGADLLVHDTQYVAAEYPGKMGWGHSTVEYAVDMALAAGVRRLALHHHDPLRDDDAVDRLVTLGRARVATAGAVLEVVAAAEQETLDLEPAGSVPTSEAPQPRGPTPPADVEAPEAVSTRALAERSLLVAMGDAATATMLADAARADGVRVALAANGEDALRIARADQPSLLLLEQQLHGRDGLSVCREVRGEGVWGREVPVILVAESEDRADLRAGEAAGVTDWLVKPFTGHYARTRIRAWLLRMACRWRPAPRPADEARRLQALRDSGLLDTPPEERFDRVTRLASALFHTPIALMSLVDEERQWFKSIHGSHPPQTSRDVAFCAHAILGDEVMVVGDALLDPRFADNPLVTGEPRIRFYAGCPLTLADGSRIGTLCLVDFRPRQLDDAGRSLLRDLAELVQRELATPPPGGRDE